MKSTFYINKGRRCAQTAIKSIINENNLSYEKLDYLTGRKPNQITTPIQIAYALQILKINFIYPVKSFFLEGNSETLQIKSAEEFGKRILQKTNFEFIKNAWKELKNSKNYVLKEKVTLKDISNYINLKKTPICLINYDIYTGRENRKRGHYLIIHEINKDFVRIMDSGPKNAEYNKKISKKRLEDSLMHTPLDFGIVFV